MQLCNVITILFCLSSTVDAVKGKFQRLGGRPKGQSRTLKDKSAKSGKSGKSGKSTKSAKRFCRESNKKGAVSIECGSKNKGDSIRYQIAAEERGAKVDIEYRLLDDVEDEKTTTKTKFDIVFSKLVEYIPDDSTNGEYKWNESPVVQTFDLSRWDGVNENQSTESMSNFYVATQDKVAKFNFKLDKSLNSVTSDSANSLKIDVDIKDFPWKRDDTFVALLSTVESETKITTKYRKGRKDDASNYNDNDIALDESRETRSASQSKPAKKQRKVPGVKIKFTSFEKSGIQPFGQYSWIDSADAVIEKKDSNNIELDTNNNESEIKNDQIQTKSNGNRALNEEDSENEDETQSKLITNTGVENPSDIEKDQGTETTTAQISVVASSPDSDNNIVGEGEDQQQIAFSFVGASKAKEIYWDPEVGVGYSSANIATFASGIFFVSISTVLGLMQLM